MILLVKQLNQRMRAGEFVHDDQQHQHSVARISDREVLSKCLHTLKQICLQLKAYFAQNEGTYAQELFMVKQVLVESFGEGQQMTNEED